MTKRTEEQIAALVDQLIDETLLHPKYCLGRAYVEGVQAGLEWVIGDCDDHPLNVRDLLYTLEETPNRSLK